MSNKALKKIISSLLIAILVMSHVFAFDILKTEAAEELVPPDPGYANLAGMVINSTNNEPLFGAVVRINSRENLALYSADYYDESSPLYHVDNWAKETWEQTTTNADGFYVILNTFWCDMSMGDNWFMDLEISKDGYASVTVTDINPVCGATNTFGDTALTPTETLPDWRQNILPGDILYDPYAAGVGHTGLYIGDGWVIEAQGDLKDSSKSRVNRNSITKWDYPDRKNVYLLRVEKPDGLSDEAFNLIKNKAIEFTMKQYTPVQKPYDWKWYQKSFDPDSPSWYCSELVWAAYKNQDIDLEYSHDPIGIISPVSPNEIFIDNDVYVVASHVETQVGGFKDYVFLLIFSPVEITVTDEDGNVFDKNNIGGIPGALYLEDEVDSDGHVRDRIILPKGNYKITVTPKAGTDPNETYSLVLESDGQQTYLAQDVKISDIPDEPYIINSTSDGGGGHGPGGFASGFSDTEESSDNTYQAGTLDAVFSSANNFSPTTTPSQIATTTAAVQNNGSLDFQYKISAESLSGDTDLCAALNLQVKQNSADIYNSALTNFYIATSTLSAAVADNFEFIASLPADADSSLQNKTCSFSLKLKSWQTGTDDENSGFNDEEILSFSISSGDWSILPSAPGPGDVVINEIMWMGSKDDDGVHTADEWVELKNNTNYDIDLTNWQLEHSAESHGTLNLSGILPANGYFVIANYDKNQSLINIDVNQVNNDITFYNQYDDNGTITLKNTNGDSIDSTSTPTDDNWPVGENGTIKKSMERNNTAGDGTLPESWHTCDRDGMNATDLATMLNYWDSTAQNYNCGTPGHANLSVNDPTASDFNPNYQAENINTPPVTEEPVIEESTTDEPVTAEPIVDEPVGETIQNPEPDSILPPDETLLETTTEILVVETPPAVEPEETIETPPPVEEVEAENPPVAEQEEVIAPPTEESAPAVEAPAPVSEPTTNE